jgi:ribosomal protein L7/L12
VGLFSIDPEKLVRKQREAGKSVDEIAAMLIARGFGPIATIKAMRTMLDVGLDDLKPVVDRALPPKWQAANERLREAAEASLALSDGDDES